MATVSNDLEQLEEAMRTFFQAMKRPQRWAAVTARAGVAIDRPAAHILHSLHAHEGEPCRVQDLARQLGVEAPSITRKTQELEQAGYIRRVHNQTDRRVTSLTLTPSGRALSRRLWAAQRASIGEVLSSWPSTERQTFVRLFARFSADLANNYKPNKP